jgi:hypothetical protein
MYSLTYGTNKEILPAPSWITLKDFGGNLSIEDFRNNFELNSLDYLILQPPIISRQMQIEESYKRQQSKYISVNKLTNLFSENENNNLVLKRSKPIETSQLNLEITMGLKKKK